MTSESEACTWEKPCRDGVILWGVIEGSCIHEDVASSFLGGED